MWWNHTRKQVDEACVVRSNKYANLAVGLGVFLKHKNQTARHE